MGVSCRIFIRKPREGVHRAGEPVSGILSYAIDEPTEYQTAILSLVGTAECQWSESDGKHHYTYSGNETFLAIHLNILDKRPEDTVTLPVGSYEFTFQFLLPFEIPSSFQDMHSKIEYHIRVKFEKASFFSFTRKFEKRITVYGNVNPTAPLQPVTYGLQKVLFKMFATKEHIVNVKAEIAKSFLMPGENAHLELTVTNDTDTEISFIKIELVCKTTYQSTGFFSSKTKFVEKTIDNCTVRTHGVSPNHIAKYSSIVPTRPELYSIQHSNIIRKEYFLRVSVDLCFPHRNPSVLIPIVIGEGRFGDCSGIVELDDLNLDALEDQAGPSVDSPPSYWEVMNEDKSQYENEGKH